MNFDPNLDYNFGIYPVWYQQQNGFLLSYCPDLNIRIVGELPPKKGADTAFAIKFTKAALKMEVKIRERLMQMKQANMKAPSPSKIKEVLSDKKIKRLTPPMIAKLSNGKYSVDTIRRMIDSGVIVGEVSEGGHRYVLEKDLPEFI